MMRELDLAAAARHIESVARPRLDALAAKHPSVGDVRGRGAMLALEIVKPGEDGPFGPVPDPVATGVVAKAAHEAGLLLLTCGTWGNVIRLLPPLIISGDELDRGLTLLEQAFATL
jgi:4-aminobutyrate aminotransferase/(S)-3-amino-2-methylpropionate transaminase